VSTATIDYQVDFDNNQQTEADKRLFVQFFKDAVKSEFKTLAAGRPIFDEFDFIRIIAPGSRDSFVTKARDGDNYTTRFPIQWSRYKQNQDQDVTGTPLSAVPWLTVGQIAELNAVGCKTVEQLVGMPDNLSQKFMGHHQLKQRAQTFLEAANNAAPALRLQAELEKRDEQIAELRSMIEAMNAAKKAGAPPKG